MESGATEPGKIIAFYSFKGGTGRSMALANVGCILAQHPGAQGRVLLVDWDLEAPGLHRYFRKHFYGAFHGSEEAQEKTPGLIDLFIELRHRIGQSATDEMQDFESARRTLKDLPLSDYVIKTDIPGLDLIKAGRFDKQYAERVGTFEWLKLYAKSPFLIRAFAERLAADYQYVLIDSRTGLTDTSGICAMLLPEILVAVFTPNRQSLKGVVDLAREAGQYRSRSDDLRPLVIYPLPSRIEASEPSLRQLWRFGDKKADLNGFQLDFEELFKEVYGLNDCRLSAYFDDVQVQQVPRYAYGEEIAVIVEETRDRLSLTRSYQRFSSKLATGQLPWEMTAALDEEQEGEADALSRVSEQLRENAAAAYIQTIEKPVAMVTKRASFVEKGAIAMSFVGGCASAAAVAAALAGQPSPFVATPAMIATLFSAIAILFATRKSPLKEAAAALEREISAFKSKQSPYDGEEALERLRDRVDPILAKTQTRGANRSTGKVFISYRRGDSSLHAARLYDSLSQTIGKDRLFLDVESIPLGVDFRNYVRSAIESAEVMLVVIGPDWLRPPTNYLSLEIGEALRQHKRIIPVLVGGATMPGPPELPSDLEDLSYINAIELSDRRWDADMVRLTRDVIRIAGKMVT
jgi:cellulose biosynthesis protein BcsQ